MQRGNADAMCTSQVPHGRVAAGLDDTDADIIILVHDELRRMKKYTPKVHAWYTDLENGVVNTHDLSLWGRVTDASLSL